MSGWRPRASALRRFLYKTVWGKAFFRQIFTYSIIYIGIVIFGAATQAQKKPAEEPFPSYREDGEGNVRHPGLDTDVSLYINHWRNSLPREGHGGFIEQDILTPGDPLAPPRRGAVLRFLKAYRRGVMEAGSSTRPARHDREQVFFYVMGGKGRVEAGQKKASLEEGMAVVVPAGLEYRFFNPGEIPLEMAIAVEEVPEDFFPAKEMSVGSYHSSKPILGAHWAHIGRPFLYDVEPRFAHSMGFIVVSIDNFDIAQPHTHGPGTEEIWLQLRGTSLLFFGNRLLWQEPGEAFLIPPNNKVPHCSINHTDEPMLWLFFGCRKEN